MNYLTGRQLYDQNRICNYQGSYWMIYTSSMDYSESLEFSARVWYKKRTKICGFDPYSLKKSDFSEDFASLPQIEYPDIKVDE